MFALRKRFKISTKSAPSSTIPASKEHNTQPKDSKLKRLLSRKPRQQRVSAENSEDTQPNRLVIRTPIQPVQDAVGPPSGNQTNPVVVPQRAATIRMVQPSIDQLHRPQADDSVRSSANESSPSLLHDPDITLIGDDEGTRAILATICPWPEAKLEALAMEHIPSPAITSARLLRFAKGRKDRIAILQYEPSGGKCVIRTPAGGWQSRWTANDKLTLERSAETMRYLKGKTRIPIPTVIGYDVEALNTLGAPYMILDYVEGEDPLELWWGKPAVVDRIQSKIIDDDRNSDEGEDSFGGFYGKVSPDLEQTRQHILRSLAFAMAELGSLKFDQLGTFAPKKEGTRPTIEPTNPQPFGKKADEEFGRFGQNHKRQRTFDSTHAWLDSCLDRYLDDIKSYSVRSYRARAADDLQQDLDLMNGLHRLYDLIIPELPLFDPGKQETFVLGPPNLGSHNIMVDKEGNVTGIVDWDHVETRPQYLGWTIPPDWLFSDFTNPTSDHHGRSRRTMTPFEHIRYLDDYARYLREACGIDSDGWKYSTKNYMYSMIVESIANVDETKMTGTIIMILSSFMPAHVQFKAFIRQVGKPDQMGEDMEEYLKSQFRKVLELKEQHIAQEHEIIAEEHTALKTDILDPRTPNHNSAAQEIFIQTSFTQRNAQQDFLRPQFRRRRGDQIVNSPIPKTLKTVPIDLEHATPPIPVKALPPNSNQQSNSGTSVHNPPLTSILAIRPKHIPGIVSEIPTPQITTSIQPIPFPPTYSIATKQALPTATTVQISQPQNTSAETRMTGEWPVDADAKDRVLSQGGRDLSLAQPAAHPTTESPDTATENPPSRRDSREILRMAGTWPIDGDRNLLFEPVVPVESCVLF